MKADAGRLNVSYAATVQPSPPTPAASSKAEALTYLRQSRYCPSDELLGFAGNALRDLPAGPDLPRAIASWVFERLIYDLNTSGPFTTAIDTLAANAGACRDFAHLTIALCRARGVPARLVAVYAPGLFPMDFHAVVEARVDGAWQVLDATRLAPRSLAGPHRHRARRGRHRLRHDPGRRRRDPRHPGHRHDGRRPPAR